jgi:hypothetical protein
VRSGTALHGSRLPLRTWVAAVDLVAGSESGVSTSQLADALGVSHKTAWFLSHRIHAAMHDEAATMVMAEPFGDGIAQQRLALLRGAVADTHRRTDSKHMDAYLDAAAFRMRNRDNDGRSDDILLRLLRTSSSVPYAELIGSR